MLNEPVWRRFQTKEIIALNFVFMNGMQFMRNDTEREIITIGTMESVSRNNLDHNLHLDSLS